MKVATKIQLKDFADEILQAAFDGEDLEGMALQDIGYRHGLIEPIIMERPCSKRCGCIDDEFPLMCFQKIY